MQNAEYRMQNRNRIDAPFIPQFAFRISHWGWVALIGLIGCETGFGSRHPLDPMLGIHAPPTPAAGPAAPANPPPTQSAAAGGTPPLPASYEAPGPAAVAAGETATPENGRHLRIADTPNPPTNWPKNGAARGAAPSSVTVGNPVPAGNRPPAPPRAVPPSAAVQPIGVSTPAQPSPAAAAPVRSFEDAQRFLQQHGVNWQRLETEDNGRWKFTCSIPNPHNPRMNRTYETSRPFPDALSAIRAVIQKIEEPRP